MFSHEYFGYPYFNYTSIKSVISIFVYTYTGCEIVGIDKTSKPIEMNIDTLRISILIKENSRHVCNE